MLCTCYASLLELIISRGATVTHPAIRPIAAVECTAPLRSRVECRKSCIVCIVRLQAAGFANACIEAAYCRTHFALVEYFASSVGQPLVHRLLHEVFVRLCLHELERVVHCLVLIQLIVAHLLIVKLLGVQSNYPLDVRQLKLNLLMVDILASSSSAFH